MQSHALNVYSATDNCHQTFVSRTSLYDEQRRNVSLLFHLSGIYYVSMRFERVWNTVLLSLYLSHDSQELFVTLAHLWLHQYYFYVEQTRSLKCTSDVYSGRRKTDFKSSSKEVSTKQLAVACHANQWNQK